MRVRTTIQIAGESFHRQYDAKLEIVFGDPFGSDGMIILYSFSRDKSRGGFPCSKTRQIYSLVLWFLSWIEIYVWAATHGFQRRGALNDLPLLCAPCF